MTEEKAAAGVVERNKNVFVTVGTTRFDRLVAAATSTKAIDWMVKQGYTSLTVQYGTGQKPSIEEEKLDDYDENKTKLINIKCYDFQPSLDEDMKNANLILSHAGAGTVMDALRLNKKLIVVINTSLMDNHQTELADAMADRGHLFVVDEPSKLLDLDLDDDGKKQQQQNNNFDTTTTLWQQFEDFIPVPFVGGDEMDFPNLLDSFLGFSSSSIIPIKND